MTDLRFGIHAGQQHATFDEYVAIWRLAEDVGLDWASVFDHFLPIQSDPTGPCFEGFRSVEQLTDGPLVGTPEQCAARLEGHRRLGVADFLLLARPPADERSITLFAQQVAPAVRAAVAVG